MCSNIPTQKNIPTESNLSKIHTDQQNVNISSHDSNPRISSISFPKGSDPPLRQGWGLFQRTCIFTGIHFTKHLIGFVLAETNNFCGSISKVILARQNFGNRSSRVAGSKRWALAFNFPVRIWYVCLMLKCREEFGLCMNSVFAKILPRRSADFRRILQPKTFLNWKSALHIFILFVRTKLMHSPSTNQLVCFHKDQSDEMLCKLDSSEYARSFKQIPTLP